jgi:NosR/NirI family nitrous oxide reductase transcriptional regulator
MAVSIRAERRGPEEGSPPAIAVYKGDKAVAYIFSTLDILNARAYSVIPFDVIAGVEPNGRITGAKAVFHREPYVYQDPIRQPQLDTFLVAEAGQALRGNDASALPPSYVAQSTITARLMRAAVHDAARFVLYARVGRQVVTVPTLDVERRAQILEPSSPTARWVTGLITSGRGGRARQGECWISSSISASKPDDLYTEISSAC